MKASSSDRIVIAENQLKYAWTHRRPLIENMVDVGLDVTVVGLTGTTQIVNLFDTVDCEVELITTTDRDINVVTELDRFLKYRDRLNTLRPTVIHSFTIQAMLFSCLVRRLSGVRSRMIHTVTGLGSLYIEKQLVYRFLRRCSEIALRRLIKSDDVLTFHNKDDASFFSERVCPHVNTIEIVPGSGVDIRKYTPSKSDGTCGVCRVLFPGRLLIQKGIREFIAAAKRVGRHLDSVDFIIAGGLDPNNPSSLSEEELKSVEEYAWIRWIGEVDDMAEIYRNVDIVCLPSYREGLPKVLLEAGASGVPVITTDVPGCRRAVLHKHTGLIVQPRTVDGLVKALLTLVGSPHTRRRMGREARAYIKDNFSETRVVESFVQIYERILPEQGEGLSL